MSTEETGTGGRSAMNVGTMKIATMVAKEDDDVRRRIVGQRNVENVTKTAGNPVEG